MRAASCTASRAFSEAEFRACGGQASPYLLPGRMHMSMASCTYASRHVCRHERLLSANNEAIHSHHVGMHVQWAYKSDD